MQEVRDLNPACIELWPLKGELDNDGYDLCSNRKMTDYILLVVLIFVYEGAI